MPDEETTAASRGSGQKTDKSKMRRWIVRWGFAVLVLVAAAAGAYAGWKVNIPGDLPGVALKSASVYRIEIGAVTFLALYLAVMVFVFALHNRALSEVGKDGFKFEGVDRAQQQALKDQQEQMEALIEQVTALEDAVVVMQVEQRGLRQPRVRKWPWD